MPSLREQVLKAMYLSVERMNRYVLEGNVEGFQAERALQINLRQDFESLKD